MNFSASDSRFIQVEYPFWYAKHFKISTVWILNVTVATLVLFYSLSPLTFSWYRPKGDRNNVCEYLNILPVEYLHGFLSVTFLGLCIIGKVHQ